MLRLGPTRGRGESSGAGRAGHEGWLGVLAALPQIEVGAGLEMGPPKQKTRLIPCDQGPEELRPRPPGEGTVGRGLWGEEVPSLLEPVSQDQGVFTGGQEQSLGPP